MSKSQTAAKSLEASDEATRNDIILLACKPEVYYTKFTSMHITNIS